MPKYEIKEVSKYLNSHIDGKFHESAGHDKIRVFSPRDYKTIGTLKSSSEADVKKATLSSLLAYKLYSEYDFATRSKLLMDVSRVIRENASGISHLESLDTGKVLSETMADVLSAAECFEYFSSQALTLEGKYTPVTRSSYVFSMREPLGVCAGIGAWNFPIANMAWKVAPALCAGNAMVYKPSELTPITSCLLADVCRHCGFPEGCVNVVQGDGRTGELLCRDKDVRKVTFTGGVETGKKVAALCSETVKRVTLELGGKSPLVVFEDAFLDDAVRGVLLANFTSQGQVCSNAARVFVQDTIYDKFKELVVSAATSIVVGDPLDESSHSGCMISEQHFNKVVGFIERAKSQGAMVLYGGDKVHLTGDDDLSKGFYLRPCVIEGASDDMEIVREEVFGPVLCLLPFKTQDEVVRRANDTPYGLAAGVYTRDLSRATQVARSFQAGTVYVNTYNMYPAKMSFGGRKHSGYGRENGPYCLESYTDVKSIFVESGATPDPFNT